MSTYRQLIKSSTLYVELGFLPMGVNLLLAPVYTAYLPPKEYALVFLTGLVQSFIVVFISIGQDAAFARFYYNYFKKQKLLRALLSTVLLFVLLTGLVIGGILFLWGDLVLARLIENESFSYSEYGLYGFLSAWAVVVQGFFLQYYRNEENPIAFSLTSLIFFGVSVSGILIGIVYFEAMARGSVMGRAAGNCIVAVGLLIVFFIKNRPVFYLPYLKKTLNYGIPIAISVLLLTVFNNVDRVMVDQFFEEDVLGLYGFAFTLASVMAVLISSIMNALVPRVFRFLTEDAEKHAHEIKSIWQVFFLLVMFFAFAGISVVDPFLRLMINEQYYGILPYIGILFASYIISAYRRVYQLPLYYYKKTRLFPYASLINLICGIAFNLVFIPILGIWAVCLSIFVIKGLQFILILLLLRIYKLHQQTWLKLPRIHVISSISLVLYLALVWANEVFELFSYGFLNILFLLFYIILAYAMFRKQISFFMAQGRQILGNLFNKGDSNS